jgi:hypothetical protein
VRLALSFASLTLLLAFSGCGSKSGAVGEGGECEVATDCAEGLICEPSKDGSTRVCSSDLSGVQKTPAKPADAGRPPTDASGAADAPTSAPDAPASAPDATGD